jgi:hypothetical protein
MEKPPSGTYEGDTVLDVLMDLEFVNDVCPLDFDKLLAFDDQDFLHDLGGIYRHFNRETKTLEDGFNPRCSKPEPKPVAQPVGPTSGEAFDKSRATNIYLAAARDLGTDLGGFGPVDLLMDKTDWRLDKCRDLAEYVLYDESIKRLLDEEGIPKFIDPVREYVDSDEIALARGATQDDLDKENL